MTHDLGREVILQDLVAHLFSILISQQGQQKQQQHSLQLNFTISCNESLQPLSGVHRLILTQLS